MESNEMTETLDMERKILYLESEVKKLKGKVNVHEIRIEQLELDVSEMQQEMQKGKQAKSEEFNYNQAFIINKNVSTIQDSKNEEFTSDMDYE